MSVRIAFPLSARRLGDETMRVDVPLSEGIRARGLDKPVRASLWRRTPGDAELTAALIAAIDEREQLGVTS